MNQHLCIQQTNTNDNNYETMRQSDYATQKNTDKDELRQFLNRFNERLRKSRDRREYNKQDILYK